MILKEFSLCLLLSAGAWTVCFGENPPGAAVVPSQEAQSPGPINPPKAIESSVLALTNTSVRMVEPGIFEVGKVRLDQRHRNVSFPAVLNRADGPMEYFLVTSYGKTHESILKTSASPFDIHLAMLLLGEPGSGSANFPGSPTNGIPGPVIHPSAEALPGDKVEIEVKWKAPQGEVRHAAEDLVYKQDTQTALQHGAWVYNGSLIIHGKFLAQEDGSIISLVTDPVALINSVAPGHDNDMIWTGNTNNLPPADLPVEVTITLKEGKAK